MARSRFSGVKKLRRTLRRADPEITKDLKAQFKRDAETIADDAAAAAYVKGIYDTGEMIDAIQVKMGRDGLTAVIGPGAKVIRISKSPFNTTLYITQRDKDAAWQFFKGYWAEFGTKGYPERDIPAQPPRPFMQPAFDANKDRVAMTVKRNVRIALSRLASG